MLTRSWPILIIVVGFLASSSVVAQVIEEEAIEVLKPMPGAREPPPSPDLSSSVQQVIRLTNEFREKEKLKAVAVDPRLKKTAQNFADYMARTSRYGHKADGATPADRVKKSGYAYCIIAENIAYEYSSEAFTAEDLAKSFFEGWRASPGHRRNMLDEDVIETGVAIAQGAETGYFFAVQMFGRPKSKALEFAISNESPDTFTYKMGDRKLTLAPAQTRTHQVCRLRDMAFRWRDGKDEEQTVQSHNGDQYIVTGQGDALQLRKE